MSDLFEVRLDNNFASSFWRKLLLASLIDVEPGISAVTLQKKLGWHINTIHKNLQGLGDIGVNVVFEGPRRGGGYRICNWGPIDKTLVKNNLNLIQEAFESMEGK